MFEVSIKELRDRTQIIAIEALEGIRDRFYMFVKLSKKDYSDWAEAFDEFFMPVEYMDFLAFAGKEITYDGQTLIVKAPCHSSFESGKKKSKNAVPLNALAPISGRFCSHRSPDIKHYPVDADMKIYFDCQLKEPKPYRTEQGVALSYNELADRCGAGRTLHWIEGWNSGTPMNTFLADLNKASWGPADPLYRKTPDGQPKVDEILRPGTLIKIKDAGIQDRDYIVKSVNGPHEYKPIERPDTHIFETYSIEMINPESKKGGYYCNELVAVDGRVLHLFMENQEEVAVLSYEHGIDVVCDDEDEFDDEFGHCEDGECEVLVKPKPQPKRKYVQLTLF